MTKKNQTRRYVDVFYLVLHKLTLTLGRQFETQAGGRRVQAELGVIPLQLASKDRRMMQLF